MSSRLMAFPPKNVWITENRSRLRRSASATDTDTVRSMRRVWMIRTGENGEAIDAMRRAGKIGLRYETVGDAREWTPAEIEKGVAKDPKAVGHAQLRTILLWFSTAFSTIHMWRPLFAVSPLRTSRRRHSASPEM